MPAILARPERATHYLSGHGRVARRRAVSPRQSIERSARWKQPSCRELPRHVERDRPRRPPIGPASVWADDAQYVDPLASVSGHDQISDLIGGVHQQAPGHVFRLLDDRVDTHHNLVRFSSSSCRLRRRVIAIGFDVAVTGEDGRIGACSASWKCPAARRVWRNVARRRGRCSFRGKNAGSPRAGSPWATEDAAWGESAARRLTRISPNPHTSREARATNRPCCLAAGNPVAA